MLDTEARTVRAPAASALNASHDGSRRLVGGT